MSRQRAGRTDSSGIIGLLEDITTKCLKKANRNFIQGVRKQNGINHGSTQSRLGETSEEKKAM